MIQFENVSKSVGGTAVLTGVSFEVPTGELVVLAGPSGCGKTTTLKMINRLIAPTSGRVLIDGEDVARQLLAGGAAEVTDLGATKAPRQPS